MCPNTPQGKHGRKSRRILDLLYNLRIKKGFKMKIVFVKKFTKTVIKGSCESGFYRLVFAFVRLLGRFLATTFRAVWRTKATAR